LVEQGRSIPNDSRIVGVVWLKHAICVTMFLEDLIVIAVCAFCNIIAESLDEIG